MGTKVSGNTNTTTQATPTAQEQEMQKAQLAQYKAYEPGQTEMYNNAFSLGNQLLTSFGQKDSNQWQYFRRDVLHWEYSEVFVATRA